MKSLRQVSLPARLMLIALLPLVFFIGLALQVYKDKTEKITVLEDYLKHIKSSFIISALIDELQTERRYTFSYAVKKGDKTELLIQRQKTDEVYNKLQDSTDEMLSGFTGYTMLNRLKDIRDRVDAGILSPDEIMNYYTNTIFRLNNLNNVSDGNLAYLKEISNELAGQKLLSELVTHLGVLRANLYYDLYRDLPPTQIISRLHSSYDLYNTFQTEFLVKSSAGSAYKYNKIRNRGNLHATIQFLDNIFYKEKIDSSFNAEEWWTVSANGVDELKTLQRNLLKQVNNTVVSLYTKEKSKKNNTIVFLSLGLLGVIALVFFTINVINKMLTELMVAAQKISEGTIGVKLSVKSNDVIGSLANSILKIDQNNKILADEANAIGQGNFDVIITPRSKEDVLAISIKKMKQALRQFNKENQDKIWIHRGIEAVSSSITGEKDVKSLAGDVLDVLVPYLNASLGLFYTFENNTLVFAAGYAVADLATVPLKIKLGETLAGQAALDKKTIQLSNLPDDYISVKSAAGNAKAKHVIIIPLVNNDVIEGVIEIGSLYPFNELALSLTEQLKPAAAVAMQTAKNRAQLQALLERTQTQAEELKMQHEDLENLNAELEAQTHKLQASEEELKVQQEELIQTNKELEEHAKTVEERNQLIIEINKEIRQKARELELSSKYKSQFLANMSHELRTPLNSILLLSRLLAENIHKNLSPEQTEFAQVIQSSGNGLLQLIDEILDLSKIEAGKMELELSHVTISGIADNLIPLFSPVAKDKKVDFSIGIDPDVPATIFTDKMRLEQVLKNLISNSLKFTPRGTVSLKISRHADKKSFVTFRVKDTGIGIAKEKQQLIFEAFQQEDGSTRRQFGGTGLGLSISKELTRILGGKISVVSEPGKGSEFIVDIPETATAEATDNNKLFNSISLKEEKQQNINGEEVQSVDVSAFPAFDDDRNDILTNDRAILIVEDDSDFAKALLNYTRQKGYKGIVAQRGDEGIELAKKYRPAGILLDIQLPVKNGWEVMKELRNNASTRLIPVHTMSSHSAKKESLQNGAIDFIDKPAALDKMHEVFKKIEEVTAQKGKKVLIVEENFRHAKALAYFLETCNITAEISDDISVATTALKRDNAECVIAGMSISDENAFKTFENLKEDSAIANVPVIVFTSKHLSPGEEQKVKQYANSIIIKTAFSYKRILDEVSLFLHLMDENRNKKPLARQQFTAMAEVLAGKKILIADDDIRNIFSLTKALEQNNMKVLSAMDGEEAISVLNENIDTNVVLMDVMMPVLDGFKAIKKIRENHSFQTLPIIAVTAKTMTGDREKCIEAGASDYISKPVDIDQLLSLLRVWLYE